MAVELRRGDVVVGSIKMVEQCRREPESSSCAAAIRTTCRAKGTARKAGRHSIGWISLTTETSRAVTVPCIPNMGLRGSFGSRVQSHGLLKAWPGAASARQSTLQTNSQRRFQSDGRDRVQISINIPPVVIPALLHVRRFALGVHKSRRPLLGASSSLPAHDSGLSTELIMPHLNRFCRMCCQLLQNVVRACALPDTRRRTSRQSHFHLIVSGGLLG